MATNKKSAAKTTTAGGGVFRPVKPFSVGTVRGRLGLTRKVFSRLAGFSERAIATGRAESP